MLAELVAVAALQARPQLVAVVDALRRAPHSTLVMRFVHALKTMSASSLSTLQAVRAASCPTQTLKMEQLKQSQPFKQVVKIAFVFVSFANRTSSTTRKLSSWRWNRRRSVLFVAAATATTM